jgi:predicted phage baseplate assembly protein
VIFGDGVQGSRLPTGAGNVLASYRTGIGPDGEVDAGTLTLPVVRPLGIRGVNNPVAATGAASPASIDDARANAPLTITTLGRAVSTRDVENFARAFLGVGKAQAVLLWNGSSQIIHVTIGTSGGEPVPAGAPLLDNLAGALRLEGDPALLFEIDTYAELEFRVSLAVAVDPSRQEDDVHQAVKQALIDTFSFAERDFGQPVTAAEVMTAAQRVPGVVAVNIDLLYLTVPSKQDALPSLPARFNGVATTRAQLLVVDPAGITITELATT